MVVGEEGAEVDAFRLDEAGSDIRGTAEEDANIGPPRELDEAPATVRGAADTGFVCLKYLAIKTPQPVVRRHFQEGLASATLKGQRYRSMKTVGWVI